MHGESGIVINGGTIDITKSYEGMEAMSVVINGGEINVVASDDGINGAGGIDTSAGNTTKPGRAGSSYGEITVNGGNITITAATSGSGDGVDSNGNIKITGGTIKFTTPNGARDYSSLDYDGSLTMTGGEVYIDSTLYTSSNIKNISTMQNQGGGKMR